MSSVKWSHSSLKDFEGCARRYHEVKVLKKYPQPDTEQTRYGKDLHRAAELYGRDGTPLPKEFEFIKPTIDAVIAKPGRKYFEYEMALTEDLRPCGFKDENVWVRGIADVCIIDDDNLTAWVFDYKTGNNRYPDTQQLDLMALMVFAHHPHIRLVKSGLLFVVKDSVVKHRTLLDNADKMWWRYRERVAKLAATQANNVWNPTQSALCPWCPVRSCEHHPKH